MIVSERSEPVVISASTMISTGRMGLTPETDIAESITGRKTPEEPVMTSIAEKRFNPRPAGGDRNEMRGGGYEQSSYGLRRRRALVF